MEASSQRPENDVIALTLPEFLVEADDDLSQEFPIKEEMIEEVMQELYKEITCPTSTCTETAALSSESILSGSSSLPPPSPLSPYFINSGKSESCGASVSNSESSVMAGVEFAGGVWRKTEGGEREWEEEEEEEERMMNGCDGVKFGDEWLEKVMGWGPLEVEGWS